MIIGIVGGVGCGKSTVLTYLKEKYNAYIIEADKVAKEIMEKILMCPKCKQPMNWVEGTNICACSTCTYTIGKKEKIK